MHVILLADAGPLITLAYADALDLLFAPGWSVQLVDMVVHEVQRNETPTSKKITAWIRQHAIPVLPSEIYRRYDEALTAGAKPHKSNLGELATQEVMNQFVLREPPQTGVFLFEDHKIARVGFVLPENCRKVSTRAFLLFLQQQGWIESAADIESKAIRAGRKFSQLRFPPD
ncbi:MAG: hypothetical protein KDJ99_32285 [Candidatus Competibacteraceae bacterium]|nr:hypothetical protein [Candidatus Competibacteraceae bacterium]